MPSQITKIRQDPDFISTNTALKGKDVAFIVYKIVIIPTFANNILNISLLA